MKVKNRKHLKALIKKRDKEEKVYTTIPKNFGKFTWEIDDKLYAR